MIANANESRPVLVIDDDHDIREVVGLILERAGYRSVAAGDGHEALRLVQEGTRPCLILLDLMMPGMNGWQLLDRLAADPAVAGVPVVVLTGGSSQEGLPAPVVCALRKPVELTVLVECVRRWAI